jgi:diguanylate cyclase (GGDEF)-like protein
MNSPITTSPDDFPIGCLVSGAQRQILFANRYLEEQFGHPLGELIGADLYILLSRASQIMYDSYLLPIITKEGRCDEVRLTLMTRSGEPRPAVVSAVRDQGGEGHLYWSIGSADRSEQLFGELTEARTLLQQKVNLLHTRSDTDQLTGLPNRAAMTDHLSQRMIDCKPGELAFALAFVDLDGFKAINDRYGHHIGDKVLRLVARRMANNLRSDDLIARFGGDEFVILLHGEFSAKNAEESLARIILQIAEPIEVDSLTLDLAASAGLTLYPQSQEIEPDQLIRQADQAMYQAKLAGRNQVCLFNINQETYQRNKNSELAAIRDAMAAGQFELYYQPKVNMRTGEIMGAEALIRWNHPDDGLRAPDTFLPLLENTTLGLDLGRWVITSALAQLQEWLKAGLDVHVSVNIAGYHLQYPNFFQDLSRILASFPDVPKQRLELEVLETSTIEDLGHVSSVLGACRAMGIRVSLDDFGTGFSTLGHLRELSVDILKIDRSFVQDMLVNAGDLAIIKGIVGFAGAFDCQLVAEGVETLQHGQTLVDLGCEWGQGYFMARPMPGGEFSTWHKNWQHDFNGKFGLPSS